MSIYPLLLPGWEQTSIWGHDIDHLYAQVTRNGVPDDNGPEFWITPPRYPVCNLEHELAAAISQLTGVEPELVLRAMTAGADPVFLDGHVPGPGLPRCVLQIPGVS